MKEIMAKKQNIYKLYISNYSLIHCGNDFLFDFGG